MESVHDRGHDELMKYVAAHHTGVSRSERYRLERITYIMILYLARKNKSQQTLKLVTLE